MQHKIFVDKILKEAKYEKDFDRNSKISDIIDSIETQFYNYKGENTKTFFFNKHDKGALVKIKDISIFFYDKNYPNAKQSGAEYNRGSSISIYGCTLDWNENENGWNNFHFDKSSLYHELIHYFDYQNIENDNYERVKIKNKNNFTKDDYTKYLNHGTEFNAHFMQHVLPIVKDIITYNKRRYNISSFEQFKKEIFNNYKVKEFYDLLTNKMKKHFLKRIAEYYQEKFKK